MPIMFHILDCMRVNAYIACKGLGYKGTHKQFTMEWCTALFARARAEDVCDTRTMRGSPSNNSEMSPTLNTKKRRMSHTRPELPDYRLKGNRDDHQLVLGHHLRTCTYCSYMSAINKLAGLPAGKPARSKFFCYACGDHLCKEHMECFHAPEQQEDGIPTTAV